jgi:hypothetical protein
MKLAYSNPEIHFLRRSNDPGCMETFGICVSDGVIAFDDTLRSIAKSNATMFTEWKPKYSGHGDPAIFGDTELLESL